MALETINNGEDGDVVRGKINNNFLKTKSKYPFVGDFVLNENVVITDISIATESSVLLINNNRPIRLFITALQNYNASGDLRARVTIRNESSTAVCDYYETGLGALKSGVESVALGEFGNSGISAVVEIDWTELQNNNLTLSYEIDPVIIENGYSKALKAELDVEELTRAVADNEIETTVNWIRNDVADFVELFGIKESTNGYYKSTDGSYVALGTARSTLYNLVKRYVNLTVGVIEGYAKVGQLVTGVTSGAKGYIISIEYNEIIVDLIVGSADFEVEDANTTSGGFTISAINQTNIERRLYASGNGYPSANTCLAVYYDQEDNYINSEYAGDGVDAVNHRRSLLNIPDNAAKVGLSSQNTYGYPLLELEVTVTKRTFNDINATILSPTLIVGTEPAASGYYRASDGVLVTPFAVAEVRKFDISGYKNRDFYATGEIGSNALYCLVAYFDYADNWISSDYVGDGVTNQVFVKQKLHIPSNCKYIGLTSLATYGIPELHNDQYNALTQENAAQLYTPRTKQSKKLLWLGTSIPASGYPLIVGEKLKCNVYNEALGSSRVRAYNYDGTWVGMGYIGVIKALSHTIAEKQLIIDYWESGLDESGNIVGGGTFGWRDLLVDQNGTVPTTLNDQFSNDEVIGYSFEKRIIAKYCDSTHPDFIGYVDFMVWDHGHNDLANLSDDENDASAIAIPATRDDRTRFCGAMNYVIDRVLEFRPRQRMIFVGHYENDRKTRVYQGQEVIADYWGFPLIKAWELYGWSQQSVDTTGFWTGTGQVGTVWTDSGGTLQTLTLTQIWMQDDLHPYSEVTKDFIAGILAKKIEEIL